MRTWKNTKTFVVVVLALLQWGCFMAETKVFQPTPSDRWKEVPASDDSTKLDADVKAYLLDRFSIKSASYYLVPGGIPWVAVSKNVRNEMAEKSIQQKYYESKDPNFYLVDVYPQGSNGAGFAVAMSKEPKTSEEKLVGFYVLSAPATAK